MQIEPFELNGKTIIDCHSRRDTTFGLRSTTIVFEFSDGTKATITQTILDDEILGTCVFGDLQFCKE